MTQRHLLVFTFLVSFVLNAYSAIELRSTQMRTSDGLPNNSIRYIYQAVYYYVKEGPAEIEGNKLVFTRIPPRSKFPLKVTVVAWQYGLAGEVQTAESVERSFFIYQ